MRARCAALRAPGAARTRPLLATTPGGVWARRAAHGAQGRSHLGRPGISSAGQRMARFGEGWRPSGPVLLGGSLPPAPLVLRVKQRRGGQACKGLGGEGARGGGVGEQLVRLLWACCPSGALSSRLHPCHGSRWRLYRCTLNRATPLRRQQGSEVCEDRVRVAQDKVRHRPPRPTPRLAETRMVVLLEEAQLQAPRPLVSMRLLRPARAVLQVSPCLGAAGVSRPQPPESRAQLPQAEPLLKVSRQPGWAAVASATTCSCPDACSPQC